ncbi:unnamed protein product [Amoebophrya sp. A120]|nr:unnamed protein product [Amoebophrya sp. A120]|eukprot:GSA120T00016646001.1
MAPPNMDSLLVPEQPALRPHAGFCLKAKITSSVDGKTSLEGSRMYLNFCSHPLIEAPRLPNGKPASKEWILKHGLGNMQVPLDLGSYRKLKLASEGKQSSFAVDVVFHPTMVELFMNEDFNTAGRGFSGEDTNPFRPYLSNVAFNMIERELKVKLSREGKDIKLVKETKYKDYARGGQVHDFQEIMTDEAVEEIRIEMEKELKQQTVATSEVKFKDDRESLNLKPDEFVIRESKPKAKPLKKTMKGFLNKKGAEGSLYGEAGSTEGVLPENAGDPMGFLPKKLRNTCKIVDTNTPEYQAAEAQRKAAAETNAENSQMMKDMEKWAKKQTKTYDRWAEDKPIGKYDVDYSKFDKMLDDEEDDLGAGGGAANAPKRDWYYDSSGKPHPLTDKDKKSATGKQAGDSAAPSKFDLADFDFEGLAKGFLDQKPGKEQSAAPDGVEVTASTESGAPATLGDSAAEVEDGASLKFSVAVEGGDDKASLLPKLLVTVTDCERPREVELDATAAGIVLSYDGGVTRIPLQANSVAKSPAWAVEPGKLEKILKSKVLDVDKITAKASTKKKTLVINVPVKDPISDLD